MSKRFEGGGRVGKKKSKKKSSKSGDELQRNYERRMASIQERVADKRSGEFALEQVFRHLSTIDINVQCTEIEWTSTFPDQAGPHGVGNVHFTRTWDYDGAGRLQKACERLIRGFERMARHVDSLSIDLDEEEITIESCFPDWNGAQDEPEDDDEELDDNVRISRTVSLDKGRWKPLRSDVAKLVEELHERMLQPDEDYDADRCMRCKHSDCCYDWRIHMTEAERVRILEHIGEPDTPETYAKYFEPDEDLSGFYRSVFRHVGEPAPEKEPGESDGHCSFLKPGPDGRPGCSIYEVRPQVCRDFDAGYCTEWTKLLPGRK
jgi:Fe-S-cluster containining protein